MANTNEFDAIVVGSGISGGWAAKELCEKGLKTLVLERGRLVEEGCPADLLKANGLYARMVAQQEMQGIRSSGA